MSAVAGLILLCHLSTAAEPRVAFSVKDGWVELVMKQDGKPVADAVVLIHDDRGQSFGEGQTDENGEATFPQPRGESFVVEIKSGSEMADPVRLLNVDSGVEPSRVLLSYGLRACCRFKDEGGEAVLVPLTRWTPAPTLVPGESNRWMWLVGGVVVFIAVGGLAACARRR